jgi:membrane-associated protein
MAARGTGWLLDSGLMPLADAVMASPISPDHLLNNYGVAGLLLIIFAECGLLVGFFLPGDTLLFACGLLIATDKIHTPLAVAVILLPVAATIGNIVGYWIGYQVGPRVFDRPNSRIFRPEFVERSAAFFERWGPLAIIAARFVPIVRTVATVLAGVSRMPFLRYLAYSVIGAILWTDGVTLLGYWLGHIKVVRDTIEPLIDPILLVVVVISLIPTAVHILRGRREQPSTGAHAAVPPTSTDAEVARDPLN